MLTVLVVVAGCSMAVPIVVVVLKQCCAPGSHSALVKLELQGACAVCSTHMALGHVLVLMLLGCPTPSGIFMLPV